MRRHENLSRSWVRRFPLVRPRFADNGRVRGGATFTMLLFVLLLVSTGFMYFYYQKCKALDRELSQWRSGQPAPQEEKITTVTRNPLRDVANAMRDRLIATPASQRPTPTPPQKQEIADQAPESTVRHSEAEPRKVRVAEATPESSPAEIRRPRETDGLAQASEITETNASPRADEQPESAAPRNGSTNDSRRPATRSTRTGSAPAVKVRIPRRTPGPKPESAGGDAVADILRARGSSSSD